jgi:outer membrane protein OmpA-like peptidoglycan-associated protein
MREDKDMGHETRFVLLTTFLLCGFVASVAAADLKDAVNSFYKDYFETLRSDQASLRALAEKVKSKREIAEKCLRLCKAKLTIQDGKSEAWKHLYDNLEISLQLTAKGPDCSEKTIGPLVRLANNLTGGLSTEGYLSADDPIFVIQNIIRLCPEKGGVYYCALGELYLRERQFGMAQEAFKNASKFKDDERVKNFLATAESCISDYANGKPIVKADIQKLMRDGLMGVEPRTAIKVRNAIQTNRILFDEWKYDIKKQTLAELDEVGKGLQESFAKDNKKALLIEGHTDKGGLERGLRNKLMILSEKRAEAIKDYLVKKFGIDPSRLQTRGYGPDKPFTPRTDRVGLQLNRRVEFKMDYVR